MDDKEYEIAKRAFWDNFPDCPKSHHIPVLNLIMKRKYAEAILRGEKTVEFRAFSKHYCERMFDNDVLEFLNKHAEEQEVRDAVDVFFSPLRLVGRIHFHNYNNSWHLDVECVSNGQIAVVPNDVKFLNDTFGCHELDEELKTLELMKIKERPIYFYYALGDVISTNIELK